MTDPIDSLGGIMQILRQRMSEQMQRTGRHRSAAAKLPKSSGGTAKSAKPSVEELKRQIAQRIRSLSPADRERRPATRVFVESVLLWEFGEQAINDPEFVELSREVEARLSEDPVVGPRLKRMLERL